MLCAMLIASNEIRMVELECVKRVLHVLHRNVPTLVGAGISPDKLLLEISKDVLSHFNWPEHFLYWL